MKLSAKLTWMLVILLGGIVVMGVFSLYQMDKINDKGTEISENWLPSSVYIQRLNTLTSDLRIYEVNHIFSEEPDLLREYEENMAGIIKSISEVIPKYKALISSPSEQQLYESFMQDWTAYQAMNSELVKMSRELRTKEAITKLRNESRALFDRMSATLMKAVEFNVKGGEISSAEGNEMYGSAQVLVISILGGLTLLAAVLGTLIVRGTLQTLGADPGDLMSVARRVTNGDYNIDNGQPKKGVYADIVSMVESLKEHINRAREESERAKVESDRAREAMVEAEKASQEAQAKTRTIMDVADRLEDVVGIVSSASTELSAQIEQSEHGASEQASRITETATAMEEMNSTVLEVARNAGAASDVSASTRSRAEAGATVVSKVVSSIQAVQRQTERLKEDMVKLDENAKSISQIMGVISDIADQTNLLALNAAIEAARAGEAGRGFAVVADEVRKLAEKTMASTTDVGNAIRAIQDSVTQSMGQMDMSVRQVEEATEFATQSGSALSEIVSMVDNTADQVRAIATASEQQSATSDEISRSISQVNVIASETAQAMGEASRAVSDLARQSQVLTQLIEEMKQG